MNSELREPITEADHAPPRALWYHATLRLVLMIKIIFNKLIRAEDAAQVLSQRQAGSYLVRKSPNSSDSYRLSVVDNENVRFFKKSNFDFFSENCPFHNRAKVRTDSAWCAALCIVGSFGVSFYVEGSTLFRFGINSDQSGTAK